MSGKGYGLRDSVQAPLTLITTFGRLASSSTFGRSAQGCAGAGGTRGCRMPRWSMMNIVSSGRAQDPVEARVVRLALRLFRQHDADSDRARRLLPVGDDIGHHRIV